MRTDQVAPARQHQGSIRCSYVDESMHAAVPVLAFFYRERLDPVRVAQSLARVLDDFPAFCGRFALRERALYIEPSRAGVRFEEQETAHSIEALMAAARRDDYKPLVPPLSVRRMLRGSEPLMAVRLTNAPDGSVLALAFSHGVGDLASAMLLLRAWSNASRDLAHEKPLDVPDRHRYLTENLPDPPETPAYLRLYSTSQMLRVARQVTTRKRRVDLHFGSRELDRIRLAGSLHRNVSRHDALCAHVFLTLRQLDARAPRQQLSIMINYRRHLGLPSNLLGNLVSMISVTLPPESYADLSTVAAELRQGIEEFAQRPDYLPTARLLAAHTGAVERLRCLPLALDPRAAALAITSCSGSGAYDLVFDSAQPALFQVLSSSALPFFGICFDSPAETGLTLSLYLPEALARELDTESGREVLHRYADEPAGAAHSGAAAPPPA